jgi:hypothetical protein
MVAEAYAGVKAAKYADQDKFISFILETGGRGPRLLDTLLREAMQALWRVQAHMLARIVVEIRAADIAVELER